MKRNRNWSLLALGVVGVAVGVSMREAVLSRDDELPVRVRQAVPPVKRTPSPEEIAGPHLQWAEQEAADVLNEHLAQLDLFFAEARQHTPQFADRALGWSSKWRLAAEYVPFTKGGRHEAFIRQEFEQHIFTPQQLAEVVEHVVANYLTHLRSIESQMLVKVRADTDDFPETFIVAELDESRFRSRYDEAVSQALAATGSGLRSDIATQLVSLIAGEVLTQVATRLGVSAGILGTGAASSWATFGVGLVVGLIVDQIVSWVWDWYADPTGNLAVQLDSKLAGLNRLIVDGADGVQGLRARLKAYSQDRARVRKEAVLAVLQTPALPTN